MINNTEQLLSLLGKGEAELIHGDERYPLTIETSPHCTQNCPAGINVKGYVNLIANRRYAEALELIREMNPFPGICGRVCTRPCELNCNPDLEDPVSIRALKRFVADYEISRKPAEIKRYPIRYREKIAVIGSGPAGLTTALDLVRLGYTVTVFEAMNRAGGMLAWGIPEFRIPRDVLEREIRIIESMGVVIKTGQRIEDPTSLSSRGFDAVLIAAGSWKGLPLNIEGEDLEGVVDCLEFLRMVYRKELTGLKGRVVVIGGGDSAIDAARTAIRLGADSVTIAYRRTELEMPAEDAEIRETKEEGTEIMILSIPVRIIGDARVEGIELLRAKLGEEDESGRRRPIPIEGSEFILGCEWVIPSISAKPDLAGFEERGIRFTEEGLIDTNGAYQCSMDGIFAVGDVVSGPSTIVDVIGSGHRCAASIHAFLRGEVPEIRMSGKIARACVVVSEVVKKTNSIRHPSYAVPAVPLEERLECFADNERHCFMEIKHAYPEQVAMNEASRCMRCGACEECQVCLPSCNEKQVVGLLDGKEFLVRVPCELSKALQEGKMNGWRISANGEERSIQLSSLTPIVNPELCIACAQCEDACAYRAARVGLKANGKAYSHIDHDICRSCGRCVLTCPTGAISLDLYGESKLQERIGNSIRMNDGIAVFNCHWSHWSSADAVGSGIQPVEFMCSSGITPAAIIRALAAGARGVLIFHCDPSLEHYLDIDYGVEEIVKDTRDILRFSGVNPNRVMLSLSFDDPERVLNEFRTRLRDEGLKAYQPALIEDIPGRIGRELAHLSALSIQEGIEKPPSFLLKGKVLKGAGMADTLDMAESIFRLASNLGIRLDVKDLEEELITPTEVANPELLPLPSLIVDSLTGLTFKDFHVKVGIHRCCSGEDSVFYDSIRAILEEIPGCEIIELEQMECGATAWRHPDASTREKAMKVYRNAEQHGADLIIPTSADCLTHLRSCNFPGAWRYSSVVAIDIYSFIIQSLKEDVCNE